MPRKFAQLMVSLGCGLVWSKHKTKSVTFNTRVYLGCGRSSVLFLWCGIPRCLIPCYHHYPNFISIICICINNDEIFSNPPKRKKEEENECIVYLVSLLFARMDGCWEMTVTGTHTQLWKDKCRRSAQLGSDRLLSLGGIIFLLCSPVPLSLQTEQLSLNNRLHGC